MSGGWVRKMRQKHQEAINASVQAQLPKFVGQLSPTISRVMQVSNEYFTAGAVWERRANVWGCVQAAPIIKWMVGMNSDKAKIELLKRGCRWEWLGQE